MIALIVRLTLRCFLLSLNLFFESSKSTLSIIINPHVPPGYCTDLPAQPGRSSVVRSQTEDTAGQRVSFSCHQGFQFVGDPVQVRPDIGINSTGISSCIELKFLTL